MPVLSWLLCAERSRNWKHAPVRRSFSRLLPGPGTGLRTVSSSLELPQNRRKPNHSPPPNPRQLQTRARPAQPSEPIFFPKLQIHFADFPYLHASSGREAIHLGDLLRIWVRSGTKITLSPSDFQGPTPAHRTAQEPRCSSDTISLSPDDPIPGSLCLMKKRQLFLGQVSAFPSSFALPHVSTRRPPISDAGFGNINRIPFR